jgi:hypothetical protein
MQTSQMIPNGDNMSATKFMEDLNTAYHEPGMDVMSSGNEFW